MSLILTSGSCADAPHAIDLLEISGTFSVATLDKAYDSNEICYFIADQRAQSVIPPKSNRKVPISYDKNLYKKRHVIENFFEKIKRHRRIATRYDKLIENYFSFLMLSISCLILRNQF